MSASFKSSPPPLAGGFRDPNASNPRFSSASRSSSSSSLMIAALVIATAVIISASIYLLLRMLSMRFRSTFSTADDVVLRHDVQNSNHQESQVGFEDLLNSLPLFTFRSVTQNLKGGDCAVCLSNFEPDNQLRLLPSCCHAFHAGCIDKWIVSNQTCPLCRSALLPASNSDALDVTLSAENRGNSNNNFSDGNGNGGSFRIELGSISRRRRGSVAELLEGARRTYSIDSVVEYIVDDCVHEIPAEHTTHRSGFSDFTSNNKDSSVAIPAPEPPTAEVPGVTNWLREYLDRLASISSRTMSFRSSGRFFSGSSRRSEAAVVPEDSEANRAGEEISELFGWLSGI